MILDQDTLRAWLQEMALFIEESKDPEPGRLSEVMQNPDVAFDVLQLLAALDEADAESERAYYSACVFAIDLCIAQLHAGAEAGSKASRLRLEQFMQVMAETMVAGKQSLSFWLPVLNAFYDVHAELTEPLKDAYMELASLEEDYSPEEETAHLDAIRDMIIEMADLTPFEIAEQFFAQSYAMPPDFFADLIADLYSIPEGQEIALLALLHPKFDVREVVVQAIDYMLPTLTLSPISLKRLQAIRNWYPERFHALFDSWIRAQRKKGVTFPVDYTPVPFDLRATEIDGSGTQGIFIHLKKPRANRLCGILLKLDIGLKDVWVTPRIPAKEVKRYYHDAFDETVLLRPVTEAYLLQIVGHFMAINLEHGHIPGLHLLELQETLGLDFRAKRLDIHAIIEEWAVRISPFTTETMQHALQSTATWTRTRPFTESWYVEDPEVDKLVNRCCSFVKGVKVCRFEEAMDLVFREVLEATRGRWLFHFLWVALWFEAGMRRNESLGQDSFLIAYAIDQGYPLESIPIMREICRQTVANSMETMEERRTHLHKE